MSADDAIARSDALLAAIYESAINPATWASLHHHMLKNFRNEGALSEQQKTFLSYVLGHIQRALRLADTRERLQWERQQLGRFIDTIAPAICLVDGDGNLVGTNAAAKALLPRHDLVGKVDDHFPVGQRLLISNALQNARTSGHGFARLPLGQSDELLMHVGPIGRAPGSGSGPRVDELWSLVFFRQDAALRRALEHFAEHYHLTAKELSVVAQALLQPSLEAVADAERIAYHTARQHLKAVYAKTGACSQVELVAGLLRHVVVQEAARTKDAALLPHIRGLAHTHFLQVGTPQHPRQLCYAEYGDPQGAPVLYFHTLNGSRLELLIHDTLLRESGIRLVAVDRPGYGHSDYYEYESYADHTRDVRRLLDALDVEHAGILACSAGTPHALAFAARFPARVAQVHCAGAVAPLKHVLASGTRSQLERIQTQLFRVAPQLLRPALELMLRGQTVESLYRAMVDRRSNVFRHSALDVEFISRPDHVEYFVAFTIESLRQGTKAWAKEGDMANRNWDISYDRVRCPVHFWHGEQDDLFPAPMIESFASEFTSAELNILSNETHLLVFRQLDRILPEFRHNA